MASSYLSLVGEDFWLQGDVGAYEAAAAGDPIVLRVPTWLLYVDTVASVLTTSYCLVAFVFVYLYRRHTVVAMGQPAFLLQLCAGGILVSTFTVIYYSPHWQIDDDFDADDVARTSTGGRTCMVGKWFGWIGFIIIDTALFARTYGMYKVTQIRRGFKIRPSLYIGPYAAGVVGSLAVLIVWAALFPMTFMRYEYWPEGNVLYNGCSVYDRDNGIHLMYAAYFDYTMLALEMLMMLGILFFAWKLKTVAEEIGESRRLFRLVLFVLCFNVLVNVCQETIKRLIRDGVAPLTSNTLLYANKSVWSVSMGAVPVTVLIGPRLYCVWYERRHGHLPAAVRAQLPGGRVRVSHAGTLDLMPTREFLSAAQLASTAIRQQPTMQERRARQHQRLPIQPN